ncbi:MAG: hypothetical protein VKO39_04120 [Cyanobacteriota bacterium]|nr:hypothetical protein [Cyanobacteriota bacterium]
MSAYGGSDLNFWGSLDHHSLWLQLPDCQWVLCRCLNGLTVKHQRLGRVLTVVRYDCYAVFSRLLQREIDVA